MKQPFIAKKVEAWPIDKVTPYARNTRTHTQEQVAQIAASIREFGFTNPLIVDAEGTLVAGHGRLAAAMRLGLDKVPVIVADHLTTIQRRALSIADNRLAELAGWDAELLALEIEELREADFDLDLIGFTDNDLSELFDGGEETREGLTDEDDAPELQPDPVSRLGDVWLLGKHRLMCGDSTDGECVSELMQGQKANLCLTDPPYGLADTKSDKNNYIEYQDTKANLIDLISRFLPIAMDYAVCVVLTPGNWNTAKYPTPTWTMAWFTPAGVGRGPWGFCCWQPVLCYGSDPKLAKGKGCHPDAIVHTESAEDFGHPCTKPIKFWSWLMERTSEPGEVIYEPFSGSGTTIIAAQKTGRTCYAMELSPHYVDVGVRRWQEFTGEKAKRERDGALFDELIHESILDAA